MDLLLPEWLPLWVRLMVLVIAVFIGICFICMPFAVFGVKGRLNDLNQHMEDVQAQLRILLKRTVDARERLDYKVQSVPNNREEIIRKNFEEEQRKTNHLATENYVHPSVKNRKRSLEVNSFEEATPRDNRHNSFATEETKIRTEPLREDVDDGSDHVLRRNLHSPYDEGQTRKIYNPPASPEFQEDEKKLNTRKRVEPILRWPPR